MLYELHITVDHNRGPSLRRWKELCHGLEAKPLDIRLTGGQNPRQVMFAIVHEGDDSSARLWQTALTCKVQDNGFHILRTKLEVPLDKSAPYHRPAYHEAHVKSLIPDDQVSYIVGTATDLGWIASWNALFPKDAGLQKWYFTWRDYSQSFLAAGRDMSAAFAQMTDFNWHTVRMEKETVIYDSNPGLDEGWA